MPILMVSHISIEHAIENTFIALDLLPAWKSFTTYVVSPSLKKDIHKRFLVRFASILKHAHLSQTRPSEQD
jgi:hypothetical protein